MSRTIDKRVKQYQGYQKNARPANEICRAYFPESQYKLFEKHLHFCAEFIGLEKPNPKYEHFNGD